MEITPFIIDHIRQETDKPEALLTNALELLADGATIPFIARYRKEKTGGMDETVIRKISDRLEYYQQLEERKTAIIKSIETQGKMTAELKRQILECSDKTVLEDLYLPYKPKHKTRASVAKAKGLEPLSDILMTMLDSQRSKEEIVAPFIAPEKGVNSYDEALTGAKDIIAERISDDAEIRSWLREYTWEKGILQSLPRPEYREVTTKYSNYYNTAEPLKKAPSHRLLAIRRGAKEEVLQRKILVDEDFVVRWLEGLVIKNATLFFLSEIQDAVRDSYARLLALSIAAEVFVQALEKAETEAINVFSINLRNLLLASPAGAKTVLGLDPGLRTGCKVAVVDEHGDFKKFATIYPTLPKNDVAGAEAILLELIQKYKPTLIAIGNGTASKETDQFIREFLKKYNLSIICVVVSEAGASVYSASELAVKEYPDLDVTARGAISIAHRLQDPLAELVKIDPKSIGVGQYQHDVNQKELRRSLELTVESCVNYVGVDLNTASAELLKYVSGIGPVIAENIVKYRNENGKFTSRKQLREITKLGPKVFEQCAGFLRVRDAVNPLDNSAIHPESYYIVEQMAADLKVHVRELIGNQNLLATLPVQRYVTAETGAMTIQDIITELKKPGRDPRREFSSAGFSTEINDIADLTQGMVLRGTVTNVTNFGAFVDVGVHQDGLVHISQMSDKFVKSPYDIVSVGDSITVEVLSVELARKRISMKRIS